MRWRDVWKSATMNNGVLFVMMAGALLMLEWSAHNLVSHSEVCCIKMGLIVFNNLVCIQVLCSLLMPSLGKALVPFSWIMLHALELNQDCGIVLVMVLKSIIVSMAKMLV